jgi:hypothetical protein
MSKFKKKGDIKLINGGYLVDAKDEKPVTNNEFVTAQQEAHYLVTLAAKMKGKNFKGVAADDINVLIAETKTELYATKIEEFVTTPKAPSRTITKQLEEEALSFISHREEVELSEGINNKLQSFKVVNEFENFGLFFKEGIVKFDKIYTMKEITEAAKVVYSVIN